MSLRCIIVDDEPAGRRTLREFSAAHADIEILAEHSDPATALQSVRDLRPDLLFLDIRMSGMTGIELARKLPRETLPDIIFVTAYDEYAVQAFELHAIDYLLKPFDEARFADALQHVRERRRNAAPAQRGDTLDALLDSLQQRIGAHAAVRPPARLLAESGSMMTLVEAAQVEAVEADRNYVKLLVGGVSHHARSTLQQAEEALASQPMLRASRSLLINMDHVREVSRTPRGDFIFVLRSGATFTSSEGQRDRVREYLERMRVGSR